jgi:Iap family predicted aminopeptidase
VEVWATSNDTDISVTVIPVEQSNEMALGAIVVSVYTAEESNLANSSDFLWAGVSLALRSILVFVYTAEELNLASSSDFLWARVSLALRSILVFVYTAEELNLASSSDFLWARGSLVFSLFKCRGYVALTGKF